MDNIFYQSVKPSATIFVPC